MTVLILGGTGEARTLAARLVESGSERVVSSLAGRVSRPALPVGEVRIGGFGGVDGLAAYLEAEEVRVVVDATHPFAATISGHAVDAARQVGCGLVRLERPGWAGHPAAGTWTWVVDSAAAVRAGVGSQRPFLTTGRQSLADYVDWADKAALVRVVDPLAQPVPPAWTVVLARGPYALAEETALMVQHRVDLLVTKDSGGTLTTAKLDAATALGVSVVVIHRPEVPDAPAMVQTVEDAVSAVRS